MLRIAAAAAAALPIVSLAGSFYLADSPGFVDRIAHTPGYAGNGGEYPVEVCLEPGSSDPARIEPMLRRALDTWNGLHATTGNFQAGDASPAPSGTYDWETVLLHELGHCVYALAHSNGTPNSPYARYAISLAGPDQTESLAPGPDGVSGTHDDVRGDDIPYTWFPLASNNPFEAITEPSPLTMGIAPEQLPPGHRFPMAPLRGTAEKLGLPPTESVMSANFFPRESKRALTADEVNTARLALAGLDETPGTADDYRVKLVYVGERSDCELNIRWRAAPGGAPVLGYCALPAFTPLGGRHIGMGAGRTITFHTNHSWSFAAETASGTASGGTLLGAVWNDRDRDGVRDLAELGVPHVAVIAKDARGKTVARTLTASDGRYVLKLARDGNYRLSMSRPADFEAFAPRDVGSDASDSDVDAAGDSAPLSIADGNSLAASAGLLLNPMPGSARDRLRCHKTAPESFTVTPVSVNDGLATLQFAPGKLTTFCDAVDTEGVAPVADERSAMACYAGRRNGQQPRPRALQAQTVFGRGSIRIAQLQRQCWPANHRQRGVAAGLERMQCYRASGPVTTVTHSLTDGYDRRTVTGYKPTLACFTRFPGEGYLCYKTKQGRRQQQYRPELAEYHTAIEDDAALLKPGEVCVPAVFG